MRLPGVAAIAAALALAAAAPAAADVTLVQIASAAQPVHIAAARGDPARLYVVEKAGMIRVLRDGALQPQPFLDLSGTLFTDGEGGLLSVAFAPDYAATGLLYTYSSSADLHIEIHEFRRSAGDAESADPASKRLVLRIPHTDFGNHWGGQLQFGPDGFLYAGTGDGGGGGDPLENAEDLGSLLGKLLRVDPRATGTAPYSIPPSNPFVATPGARGEIWAYGLRNPWRFSFDRSTGDLAVGDVGQGRWEEVDYAPAGTGAGAFYGWDAFEGFEPVAGEPAPAAEHVPPVLVRSHADGDCSITGGYVARAPDLPSLAGRYLYADFCVGDIRSALLNAPAALDDSPTGLSLTTPSSFGEDLGGCLYAVSLAGAVVRITESPAPVAPCPPPAAAPPLPEPPPPPPPAPDTTAPETTIERGPRRTTTARRAVIAAVASEPAAFECSVDGAQFASCTMPFGTDRLAEGAHAAAIRAVDAAGNADATPASWVWRVDLDPLRRWDLQVLLRRLAREIRAGRRAAATLAPHVPGRVVVRLRNGRGKLFAADSARAAARFRIDLGRAPAVRPLVLTGTFGGVTVAVRLPG